MVVVITLIILANVALSCVRCVATIISIPIDATVDHCSETDGPRLSAINSVDVQIQPSSQLSCVFLILGPRTQRCSLQVD